MEFAVFMTMSTKISIGSAIVGAFILGLLAIAMTSAQNTPPEQSSALAGSSSLETSFSETQQDEIRTVMRDYLMSNPEIIIEAVNEYSKREQLRAELLAKENAKERLSDLLDPRYGYVAGASTEQATVAVIEFFDYHCGFCKRATPLMKDLLENEKDVQVVFRELPILREESDLAAALSLAARSQDKYLDMHFAMMESSGILTEDRIQTLAKEEGLNWQRLKKEAASKDIEKAIDEGREIAQAMGVDGTPAFIVASIDGSYVEIVTGFRPDQVMMHIEGARGANP